MNWTIVYVCNSVSDWAGQPQSVCLFHKGDQVLAINDLHTSSVEDFNMFVSKSLKKEVQSLLPTEIQKFDQDFNALLYSI